MILFPAVDIKDGQCVRLRQGLADAVTVFSPDPEAMARHWADLGAQWLHLVDLDGAFSGKPRNFDLIARICSGLSIPVQLGGGIRDAQTAAAYLKAGVRRLIIGTLALSDPEAFAAICRAFPGQVGVSLDAVDGQLKVKGWVEDAGLTVEDVLPRLTEQGAAFVVYTDISRDGMQTGVNRQALARLLELTSLPVIAAGGVATLDDVKMLFPFSRQGLEGVISGRAIYTGTLDFGEAMAWIAKQSQEVAMRTVEVKGMHCANCVASVTKALSAIPGVSDVSVSLEKGQATFAGDVDAETIKQAIEKVGFEAGEVK